MLRGSHDHFPLQEQDTTQLLYVTRAITRLEALVGKIPHISARGKYSKVKLAVRWQN